MNLTNNQSKRLNNIAKKHSEWVNIIKTLGGGYYSEDIVQESYLKVIRHLTNDRFFKDDEISKGYWFFIIRSVLFDYFREKEKYKKEQIEGYLYKIPDITNHEEEHAFEKVCKLIENDMKDWDKYDKDLYFAYVRPERYDHNKTSMRKLAKKTKISWVSIFSTLKKCKQRIKLSSRKDWDKFHKGKYDEL